MSKSAPPSQNQIPLIDDITLEVETTSQIPQPIFLISSRRHERLEEILSLFPLNIISNDVDTMRKMPFPAHVQLPEDAALRLEFSLDDLDPSTLLWDIFVPRSQMQNLVQANIQAGSLRIAIQPQYGDEIINVPGVQRNHILDWSGISGLAMNIRNTLVQAGQQWDRTNAYEIMHGMHDMMQKYGGYITGMYNEIGLIHRYLGEFDKAEMNYIQEIKGASLADGSMGVGAVRGFNNLGVIYKKRQQNKRALDAFHVALSLNPNYFEALFSVAGLIEDVNISLGYLARAMRIRPNDPNWTPLLQNMAAALGQSPQRWLDRISAKSQSVDLTSKPPFDIAALDRLNIL